jgi:hypothetical protein
MQYKPNSGKKVYRRERSELKKQKQKQKKEVAVLHPHKAKEKRKPQIEPLRAPALHF